MKIHKALKVKNRLAGEIARLQQILQRENSRRDDNPSKVDCAEVYASVRNLTDKLVSIKSAIAKANSGIYGKIYELAEAKARINFLNSLPTREGEEVAFVGRDQEKLAYRWTAFLNREAVDKLVAEAQGLANRLQDEIDSYNAATAADCED